MNPLRQDVKDLARQVVDLGDGPISAVAAEFTVSANTVKTWADGFPPPPRIDLQSLVDFLRSQLP